MKRLVILALIVGLVLVTGAADDEPTRSVDPEAAKLVEEMADLLDRALYLAIAALSWPDRDDLTLYIQGVINLLDGPNGPDYDDTGGATTPDGNGLKDLFFALLTARSGVPTVETPHLSASLAAQAVQAIEHTERYLFLAAEAAKDALDRVYSVTGGQNELRAMYAYLLAARGRTDDELVLGGIQALVEVFPALDIEVGSGQSIQAALDRAPPGATIRLDPGTYRERIVIDKDLTLVGAPLPDGELGPPATVIVGPVWDFVVAIEGDGVEVRLENLALSGGKSGLVVSGDNSVDLDSVWISNVSGGLGATDGAAVSCDACRFSDCEHAIVVDSGASVGVSGSEIRDCDSVGVYLLSGGSLTMTDTTISGCAQHAVYLQGDAALHLEGCSVVDNEGFGVFAYTAECERHWVIGRTDEYAFSGAITGANNTIPGPDEDHGNLKGDVCPASLAFLTEPRLTEVAVEPGESIQAAVNAVVEGGSVLLAAGTYRESLEIDKAVTLAGEGGVILVSDSEEVPAIRVSGPAAVTVRNITIEAASGLEIRTASCRLIDCSFRTADIGVSVTAFGSGTVDIERCAFTGEGIGVELVGDGSVGIDDCRFSGLSVGAVVGGTISATILSSSFEGCGEAIVLASSASATIEENRIHGSLRNGVRVSEAPSGSPTGSLVLNANSFANSGEWDVTLCDPTGSATLAFRGSLTGTGNVVEGGSKRLCPADYDWPDGFIAE